MKGVVYPPRIHPSIGSEARVYQRWVTMLGDVSNALGFCPVELPTLERFDETIDLQGTRDRSYRFADKSGRPLLLSANMVSALDKYVRYRGVADVEPSLAFVHQVYRYTHKRRRTWRQYGCYSLFKDRPILAWAHCALHLNTVLRIAPTGVSPRVFVSDFGVWSELFVAELGDSGTRRLMYCTRFSKDSELAELLGRLSPNVREAYQALTSNTGHRVTECASSALLESAIDRRRTRWADFATAIGLPLTIDLCDLRTAEYSTGMWFRIIDDRSGIAIADGGELRLGAETQSVNAVGLCYGVEAVASFFVDPAPVHTPIVAYDIPAEATIDHAMNWLDDRLDATPTAPPQVDCLSRGVRQARARAKRQQGAWKE